MSSTPSELVVFASAFESTFLRALKGKLSASAKAELARLGLDVDGKVLPAYPHAAWIRGLEIARADVWPDLSPRDGYFELGQQIIVSFQQTFVGAALFTALRVFSARKVISRMTRNFRTANNYTEVTEHEISPTHIELTFNLVEPTGAVTEGILSAGLPLAGLTGWAVRLESKVGDRAVYSLIQS